MNVCLSVFVSLLEELKRPLVKRTLGVLQLAKSKSIQAWIKLVSCFMKV